LGTGEPDSRPTKRRKVEKQTPSTKVSWNGNNNSAAAASTSASTTQNAATSSSTKPEKIVGNPDSKQNLAAMILRESTGKENAK
jgi:hypothetical protein